MRLVDGDVALRPLVETDAAALAVAARDPLVPYYTSVPESYTEKDAREFIGRGDNNFAIVDTETDELLGVISFLIMDHARGHFGYWVGKEARGRGVATRALRLLTRWAAQEHHLARLQLIVEPENLASIRVAERAGFRREARLRSYVELRGARRDVYMYALLAEDL
ncbi:MAG: GNAT family N-acetyltransferase [Gaiellaceae bacterium]